MNAILSRTTTAIIDNYQDASPLGNSSFGVGTLDANPLRTTQIAQMYETAPMEAVAPVITTEELPVPDEEMLHSSFEEAITERLTEQYSHWSRLSSSDLPVPTTDAFRTYIQRSHTQQMRPLAQDVHTPYHRRQAAVTHYSIIVACIALILLMSGFDLMGLLVMHLHLH